MDGVRRGSEYIAHTQVGEKLLYALREHPNDMHMCMLLYIRMHMHCVRLCEQSLEDASLMEAGAQLAAEPRCEAGNVSDEFRELYSIGVVGV